MTDIEDIQQIYKRTIVDEILKYKDEKEAIILHGARQVGKTSILLWLKQYLENETKQIFYIDLEERKYLQLLNDSIDNLRKLALEVGFNINKRTFFLIDEIQYLNNPANFIKLVVDHCPNIKLIASGSSTFEIKKKLEKALVGRTYTFEIFGLSFEEFLLFKNYGKKSIPIYTNIKQQELVKLFEEFTIFGSLPKVVLMTEKEKKEKYLWQIIDTYLRKDIRDLAGVKEIDKFNKLLEILSSQSGKLINVQELANSCGMAKKTVERYLFVLENTYIIKLIRPFHNNLRSELFKTPKIYFYDSGLANLLWLKAFTPQILGEIFETVVFSELVKRFGKESIYFWRTKDRKEIDFIVKYKNNVIPIEVKLNFAKFYKKPIEYFLNIYKIRNYHFISLYGSKIKDSFLHPWEISSIKTI